jgi:hypothetical protein
MDVERECSVCREEAPMFCRMCSLHYCPDHLCLHLNVAWETNTWTRRNDAGNIRNERISAGKTYGDEPRREVQDALSHPIPNTPKSLPAYTEAELQAQYNFYLSQARRIRVELERRCLSAEGASQSKQKLPYAWEQEQRNKPKYRKTLPKSATYAVGLLLNQMRAGTLRPDQIATRIAQMQALGAAKK